VDISGYTDYTDYSAPGPSTSTDHPSFNPHVEDRTVSASEDEDEGFPGHTPESLDRSQAIANPMLFISGSSKALSLRSLLNPTTTSPAKARPEQVYHHAGMSIYTVVD
jgi:hypothetical protein